MILNTIDRIGGSDPLPESTDVVIIGGGIAGVACALYLAEAGVRVVLCEKGIVAGEQSSRNWGWVRQMGRDPAELPLTIEALNLWRDIDRRFGIDTGFRETGITYVCRTKAEVRAFSAWADQAKAAHMPSQVLDAAGLAVKLPGIGPQFTMGLYTANDGKAEPFKAVPQMARAARRLGAVIAEHCAVRGLEMTAGKVSAVVTEAGTVRCDRVVLAGGVWSRLFLGNLGVNFPQLKIQGTVARIESAGDLPEMPVGGGDFAFRKRLDGGYTVAVRNANVAPITPDSFRLLRDFFPTFLSSWRELKLRVGGQFVTEMQMPRTWAPDAVSPFEAIRTLDPQPHAPFNRKVMVTLARAFPAFADARLTHTWSGMIDATPDAVPVIGPIAALPGLYLSSGYSGHGFGIGPGAGRLMADIVRSIPPCVDPTPFRFDRFRMTQDLVKHLPA